MTVLLVVIACTTGSPMDAGSANEPLFALVDLAAQRLQVSDAVAASKWGTDAPIKDPTREQAVLASAATQSAQLGIDPTVTVQVLTDQIEASKTIQYALYARWSAHPDQAPSVRPDLVQLRPMLDRITDELLTQLKATQGSRADRTCAARLANARHRAEQARALDQVHEDALGRALASLCRGAQRDGAGASR
jgi:chorismate mutase